jgi:hypothetical protein
VKRVFSSADQNLDGVVCEEVDHPRQQWDVCRQEYQFFLGKAFQAELMTGATDGSMPVGSISINYIINR